MSEEVKPKRRYNSTRRKEQASQTRREIVEAARRLFVARGYPATTVEAIAQEAGVAAETIYGIFRSKREILKQLVDLSIGGDEAQVGILERPSAREARQEQNQRRQIELFAHGIQEIMGRVGPVFHVMQMAAPVEPEIAELLRKLQAERLANLTQFVDWVAANGPLRASLTVGEAGDLVWILAGPDVHRLFTVERGWPPDHYGAWLADSLVRLLLP